MTGMNENPAALIPELLLLAGAVAGLLAGSWLPRRRQWLIRLGAAIACAAGLTATAVAATRLDQTVFADSYSIDTATHATRAAVLLATLLALVVSVDATAGHRRETEFVVLIQLGALGTMMLGGANDLLLLFAAFLLASIPFYALAGWDKTAAGTEAAMKYYLSGAFVGVVMLTGTTLLYGAGRATGYQPLREGLSAAPSGLVGVGLVAVLAGLLFKMAAVPTQFWVPDVADGTPAAVAAIVTTIPKIGALVAGYRLLVAAVPAHVVDTPLLLAVIAAASMTLGNLAAFFQTSPRRLLAYSAISQVGYLLMALAVAGRAELAQPALLYYLTAYAVTNFGAFAVVAGLPAAHSLDDYRGLVRRRPGLAVALVVCLLGLIGTPPTAVFVGKLTIFTAAVEGGFTWLAVLAVVNTVASVFYYLRWISPAFRVSGECSTSLVGPARSWARAGAYLSAAASLALGLGGGALLPLLGSPSSAQP